MGGNINIGFYIPQPSRDASFSSSQIKSYKPKSTMLLITDLKDMAPKNKW